jgi:ABC-type sugar transport system ATPase subunit
MGDIIFEQVWKVYPDGTEAVRAVDLTIRDGDLMVLVGPSGCGKTTLLRMVAGLEEVTAGKIRIGEREINEVAAKNRDIAMVFQNYALYPHMTVYDNQAFGLRLRRLAKSEIDQRVRGIARVLGLGGELEKKPGQLSGGQRQRVAMGRAIVRQPQAFLMDEPLSNLDAKLRVQMRSEISRMQRDLGTTMIYVTHDQTEAMTMGTQVAVMKKGDLQQVDAPDVLYSRPTNLFVAGFIGSPAMNLVQARLTNGDGGLFVEFADVRLRVDDEAVGQRPGPSCARRSAPRRSCTSRSTPSPASPRTPASWRSTPGPRCSRSSRRWRPSTRPRSWHECTPAPGRARANGSSCSSTRGSCTSSIPRPAPGSTGRRLRSALMRDRRRGGRVLSGSGPAVDFAVHARGAPAPRAGPPQSSPARSAPSCHPPEER